MYLITSLIFKENDCKLLIISLFFLLQHVLFTKNLDVTSYADGKRETHNPDGRAYAPVVWDFYNNGCR